MTSTHFLELATQAREALKAYPKAHVQILSADESGLMLRKVLGDGSVIMRIKPSAASGQCDLTISANAFSPTLARGEAQSPYQAIGASENFCSQAVDRFVADSSRTLHHFSISSFYNNVEDSLAPKDVVSTGKPAKTFERSSLGLGLATAVAGFVCPLSLALWGRKFLKLSTTRRVHQEYREYYDENRHGMMGVGKVMDHQLGAQRANQRRAALLLGGVVGTAANLAMNGFAAKAMLVNFQLLGS